MNNDCASGKSLRAAIREFAWNRQDDPRAMEYGLRLAGRTEDFEKENLLNEHYWKILLLSAEYDKDILFKYESSWNAIVKIQCDGAYRRGIMDGFRLFRMFEREDERRKAHAERSRAF